MPLYAWKGLDAGGKTVTGTRDADGPKGLRQVLRKDAVFLTELREVVGGKRGAAAASGAPAATGLKREIDFGRLFERVAPQEVAIFTRQLATLLRAGIPLAEALAALAEQADNRKLQLILAGIRQKVNEGGALADALAQHPKVFPELYINMVRSGEAAGNLDAVLTRLADFLDDPARAALQGLGRVDLPDRHDGAGLAGHGRVDGGGRAADRLGVRGFGQDLALEHPLADLRWRTSGRLLVDRPAGAGGWQSWACGAGRARPRARAVVDRLGLKMWVLGPLLRYIAVARFSRTLSTMLSSGVPLLTALEIVRKVLNNIGPGEGGRGGARHHPRG